MNILWTFKLSKSVRYKAFHKQLIQHNSLCYFTAGIAGVACFRFDTKVGFSMQMALFLHLTGVFLHKVGIGI